jgi:hypothetical protein
MTITVHEHGAPAAAALVDAIEAAVKVAYVEDALAVELYWSV